MGVNCGISNLFCQARHNSLPGTRKFVYLKPERRTQNAEEDQKLANLRI